MKVKNAKLKSLLFLSVAFVAVLICALVFACKKKTSYNIDEYVLPNGLSVFFSENHSTPLVYIEIAVKAGGVTQSAEDAGLFHLYEHMMFKGNSLYKDAASVQRALDDMGCPEWNGSTGLNCVNYFFTIPSDQLENGLAFWNAAIRSPLMDESEFEKEKKVVLSEIQGGIVEPSSIFREYLLSNIFPGEPYRLSPGGSFDVVKDASVLQLRAIQNKYYIPKNAALFVGGDINKKEALKLVKKIFGTWSNNGNEAPLPGKQQSLDPFPSVKYAVMPNDEMSLSLASIEVDFRGADSDFALKDTYPLDYMLHLLNDPDSSFKKELSDDQRLFIPDSEYIYSGYYTSRASGMISFGATVVEPEQNLAIRAKVFLDDVLQKALPYVLNDDSLFSSEKRNKIAQKLSDDDTWHCQTATGLLNQLRFWWTVADSDYFYSYNKKIASVKKEDVKRVVEKYIQGKNPIVTVLVNTEVYQAHKEEFEAAGFETISAENAFWWNNSKYAPDKNLIAKEEEFAKNNFSADENIYEPQKKEDSSYEIQSEMDVKKLALKNGIPVYYKKQNSSRINSVAIAVRGGISHLTPQTSGLEDSLFTVMSACSEKYDYAYHKTFEFETGSALTASALRDGTVLSLTAIDKYLHDALPVLTDGFLNPSYEDVVMTTIDNSLKQKVQSMLNDPQSILGYEAGNSFYKNHPYQTKTSVRPESLESITVQNMKKLHKEILKSENIFVVIVGNESPKKIIAELNKTLGTLEPSGEKPYEPSEVPPVKISGEPVILTHPAAQGTGYVSRFFAGPSVTSPDFAAAELASSMYSTVMFNVVREHYGVCYTPGSFNGSGRASVCEEYLFKLSNPEIFVKAMDEARSYMADGRLIESLDSNGEYVFASIKDRLQSYKNKYINSTYASASTTGSVASNIAGNLISFNDLAFDRKLDERIMAVTEQDILEVFKRYWIEEESQWWIMAGEDLKPLIKFQ